MIGSMTLREHSLEIGGIDVATLRQQYGTPLYVVDIGEFKRQAHVFVNNFQSKLFFTKVVYASKAFFNLSMAKLAENNGLFIDVVSGGELYTALRAGVNPLKIVFHGNNKLYDELRMAVQHRVGTIIIDNHYEKELLGDILALEKSTCRVLVRVNPGIEAHTHEYIQTTKNDSKFGLSIFDPSTEKFISSLVEDPFIEFAGLHCHIGSQIFESESFFKEAKEMIRYAAHLEETYSLKIEELNLGGGFGVSYTTKDRPLDLPNFLTAYIQVIQNTLATFGLLPKFISIEPGRALINAAGSTLYTVGAIKCPYEGDPMISVDGGMTDNPRPSLYGAEYTAFLGERMNEPCQHNYRIVGKCCESGDVLVRNACLPKVETKDLLVIPCTGAYNYSMSSNYNRIPRPAVVFVENGKSTVAVRRETYEDLLRNDEVIG